MIAPLLKGLSEERVVFLPPSKKARLPFSLAGIVRLVDRKGDTIALVLNKEAIDEIEEELEASSPEFLASLEESRKSGRVSGRRVKKNIRLK